MCFLVYIPLDYYTRQPKGFAFLEFRERSDAEKAKDALDNYEIDGRKIVVMFAKVQTSRRLEERVPSFILMH